MLISAIIVLECGIRAHVSVLCECVVCDVCVCVCLLCVCV